MVDKKKFLIGQRIRKHRIFAGLSMRKLAGLAGFSHRFLLGIEQGDNRLPEKHRARMLEVMPTLNADDLKLTYKEFCGWMGSQIFAHRQERGWSQIQLAEESGVQRSTISNLESGARVPRLDTLLRLSDALGTSLRELIPPEA